MNREIKISELEKLFGMIISKLKNDSIQKIEIKTDFYRFIPPEYWDSFNNEVIYSGSFFDDIDSLKLLLSDEKRPITYVDFDRLGNILHLISETQNP